MLRHSLLLPIGAALLSIPRLITAQSCSGQIAVIASALAKEPFAAPFCASHFPLANVTSTITVTASAISQPPSSTTTTSSVTSTVTSSVTSTNVATTVQSSVVTTTQLTTTTQVVPSTTTISTTALTTTTVISTTMSISTVVTTSTTTSTTFTATMYTNRKRAADPQYNYGPPKSNFANPWGANSFKPLGPTSSTTLVQQQISKSPSSSAQTVQSSSAPAANQGSLKSSSNLVASSPTSSSNGFSSFGSSSQLSWSTKSVTPGAAPFTYLVSQASTLIGPVCTCLQTQQTNTITLSQSAAVVPGVTITSTVIATVLTTETTTINASATFTSTTISTSTSTSTVVASSTNVSTQTISSTSIATITSLATTTSITTSTTVVTSTVSAVLQINGPSCNNPDGGAGDGGCNSNCYCDSRPFGPPGVCDQLLGPDTCGGSCSTDSDCPNGFACSNSGYTQSTCGLSSACVPVSQCSSSFTPT